MACDECGWKGGAVGHLFHSQNSQTSQSNFSAPRVNFNRLRLNEAAAKCANDMIDKNVQRVNCVGNIVALLSHKRSAYVLIEFRFAQVRSS